MIVTELRYFRTKQYPYTHRIEFDDTSYQFPVYEWTEKQGIPGTWAGGAFYTTAKYVTLISLKWSHL